MAFISGCICNFLDFAPDGRDSHVAYLFAPRQSHSLSASPSRQRVSKRSITSWTLAPDGRDSRGAYLFAPTQSHSLSSSTPASLSRQPVCHAEHAGLCYFSDALRRNTMSVKLDFATRLVCSNSCSIFRCGTVWAPSVALCDT